MKWILPVENNPMKDFLGEGGGVDGGCFPKHQSISESENITYFLCDVFKEKAVTNVRAIVSLQKEIFVLLLRTWFHLQWKLFIFIAFNEINFCSVS